MKSGQIFNWREAISTDDYTAIYRALSRIIFNNPVMARSRARSHLPQYQGSFYTDWTQDLFLLLWRKQRFAHYLQSEMTNSEIGKQITCIELPNLINERLRHDQPESWRLVIRVSKLLQTSARFKRFNEAQCQQHYLSGRVFGLAHWPEDKPLKERAHLEEAIKQISVKERNLRLTGCTADAATIITNRELQKLVEEVFEAIDSPASVKAIRALTLSRLNVTYLEFTPLPDSNEDGQGDQTLKMADQNLNPEEKMIEEEKMLEAAGMADVFLRSLQRNARVRADKFHRVLLALYHCYLAPQPISRTALAQRLEISDTLVSYYTKKIDRELGTLKLTLDEARVFETSLRKVVESAAWMHHKSPELAL